MKPTKPRPLAPHPTRTGSRSRSRLRHQWTVAVRRADDGDGVLAATRIRDARG